MQCNYADCRYAECRYAECHYAERPYAECHFAECRGTAGGSLGHLGNDESLSGSASTNTHLSLKIDASFNLIPFPLAP